MENKPSSPTSQSGLDLPDEPGVWRRGELFWIVGKNEPDGLVATTVLPDGFYQTLPTNHDGFPRGNWQPAAEAGEVERQYGSECQRLTSYENWRDAYASAAQGAETWKMAADSIRAELAACKEQLAQVLKDQSDSEDLDADRLREAVISVLSDPSVVNLSEYSKGCLQAVRDRLPTGKYRLYELIADTKEEIGKENATLRSKLSTLTAELRGQIEKFRRIENEADHDRKHIRAHCFGVCADDLEQLLSKQSTQDPTQAHERLEKIASKVFTCPKCGGPMAHSRLRGMFCVTCR